MRRTRLFPGLLRTRSLRGLISSARRGLRPPLSGLVLCRTGQQECTQTFLLRGFVLLLHAAPGSPRIRSFRSMLRGRLIARCSLILLLLGYLLLGYLIIILVAVVFSKYCKLFLCASIQSNAFISCRWCALFATPPRCMSVYTAKET
eukprot:Tamp_21020.p1 GENE.Tamp_21020~~Tamp_21020.p1  ORF type:complete len:147 (-),score=1.36 Tamp_21020:329-769(-)